MPEGTAPPWLDGVDYVSVVDIKDPTSPSMISLFPSPTVPPGADFGDFLELPGWSGPHNQSQLHHNPDVAPQGDLVYLTYFNADLHIYDVANRLAPREVAWFLPPHPTRRYGPLPLDGLVRQSEDVLVDRRGYSYVADKNQGLWILRADLS